MQDSLSWVQVRASRLLGGETGAEAGSSGSSGGGSGGTALPVPKPSVAMVRGIRLGALPVLCLVLWKLSALIGAEPLVACVTMGLAAANFGAGCEDARHELESLLEKLLPAVFVAFFGLMGAHQSIGECRDTTSMSTSRKARAAHRPPDLSVLAGWTRWSHRGSRR